MKKTVKFTKEEIASEVQDHSDKYGGYSAEVVGFADGTMSVIERGGEAGDHDGLDQPYVVLEYTEDRESDWYFAGFSDMGIDEIVEELELEDMEFEVEEKVVYSFVKGS